MRDILHRVEIESAPDKVYEALTDKDGLSAWWTKTKVIEEQETISFLFGENGDHRVDMSFIQQLPGQRVVWRCIAGPWVGTEQFSFDIEPSEKGSVVKFANTGWSDDALDFYMHCNTKWGFFLGVSLKNYLETGVGQPHPHEPNL